MGEGLADELLAELLVGSGWLVLGAGCGGEEQATMSAALSATTAAKGTAVRARRTRGMRSSGGSSVRNRESHDMVTCSR